MIEILGTWVEHGAGLFSFHARHVCLGRSRSGDSGARITADGLQCIGDPRWADGIDPQAAGQVERGRFDKAFECRVHQADGGRARCGFAGQ